LGKIRGFKNIRWEELREGWKRLLKRERRETFHFFGETLSTDYLFGGGALNKTGF